MFKLIKEFLNYRKQQKILTDPEPYIEIKSEKMDSEGNVQLVLDWNPAFIRKLREKGFIGTNDEEVIDSYLYRLFEVKYQESFLREKQTRLEEDE